MQYIAKETIDRYFGDKSIIEVQSLIRLLEKDFGTSAFAFEQSNMNEDQIMKMTKAISETEDIQKQIRTARTKQDDNNSAYIKSKEEFSKLVDEVRNGIRGK